MEIKPDEKYDRVIRLKKMPTLAEILDQIRGGGITEASLKTLTSYGLVDVYSVLDAFNPPGSAVNHAIKKLLAPGERGVKDEITDLEEAIKSIKRRIEDLRSA